MPRVCTICAHQKREAIDKTLIEGELSYRHIATQFTISTGALQRHKRNHLPKKLSKAKEAAEVVQADDLLSQVRSLQQKALLILEKAEASGDLRTALYAISQARQNLELLARLLGELQDQAAVNVLIANPEWLQVRTVIIQALEPYPDARLAVVEALDANNPRSEIST